VPSPSDGEGDNTWAVINVSMTALRSVQTIITI
jgi:hypothetical protein